MSNRRFYWISDDFRPYDVPALKDYPYPWDECHGSVYLSTSSDSTALEEGGPLDVAPDISIDLYSPELTTDVIITHSFVFVVSNRIREIVESFAPGEALFFRPRLTYEGEEVDADFWVMHPLNRLDCFVPDRSVVRERVNRDGSVSRFFGRCVIDRRRLSSSISFGRLICPIHVDLIRDDLRSRFLQAGVVGPVYQEVSYMD